MEDFFGEKIASARRVENPLIGFKELFKEAYNQGMFDPEEEKLNVIKNQLLGKARNLIYRPEEDSSVIKNMPFNPEEDSSVIQKMPYITDKFQNLGAYMNLGGFGINKNFGNKDKGAYGSVNVDKRFVNPVSYEVMGGYKKGPIDVNAYGGNRGYGANVNFNLRF